VSDPQPEQLKPRRPRAEPLQPDLPVRGTDSGPRDGEPDDDVAQDSLRKHKEQSDTAVQNNRRGFD
jgi:hypothetical protein